MERLCLITLGICVSIVLGYGSHAKVLFVHSPPSLNSKPGENATFTCNISALNFNPKYINWYRNDVKIADLMSAENERIHINPNWKLHMATLLIINVTFNDSGKYHCAYLNDSPNNPHFIIVSNASELFVRADFPGTETYEINNTDLPKSKQDSRKMSIIYTSMILVLLLLVAVGAVFIFIWYRQRFNNPTTQRQNLEKRTEDPSVYTIDYGIIEFGESQPYRKSPVLRVSEQVEYATIMFPQQSPTTENKIGR
ncbi:programmed cell death protein 1 isoform X1 [Engystomops pustulosus]|uniref:programmed cell death protein 1 isoform X1 n=1 Tax=Engystomops pustulosus TaxID=76066 RepID=UPI003AFAAACB